MYGKERCTTSFKPSILRQERQHHFIESRSMEPLTFCRPLVQQRLRPFFVTFNCPPPGIKFSPSLYKFYNWRDKKLCFSNGLQMRSTHNWPFLCESGIIIFLSSKAPCWLHAPVLYYTHLYAKSYFLSKHKFIAEQSTGIWCSGGKQEVSVDVFLLFYVLCVSECLCNFYINLSFKYICQPAT